MTNVEKEKLLAALDKLKDSYDAYLMGQRYDEDISDNTHKEEFELLSKELGLPLDRGALGWIRCCYDYYYKDDYADETNTAFGYIRNLIQQRSKE